MVASIEDHSFVDLAVILRGADRETEEDTYRYQEYIRRGKVVLRIAVCKRTLQSTKVKLRNITQNVPQTSGMVTTSMCVTTIILLFL